MEAFLYFCLYSFFGCVLENVYYYALHGKYVSKRTLLKLPLCPVYGFAALALAAVNGSAQNPAVLFVNGFLTVSAVELIFFLVSERMYNVRWWDYSKLKMNFRGGICLCYSLVWGGMNIFFAKVLHPVVADGISGLPDRFVLLCGLFLAVYITADFKDTHTELTKYKNGESRSIFDSFTYLAGNNR